MDASVNAKNYTVDGTLVACLLCRPEDNKMPLSVLRDVHLPNVHFRSTKGKVKIKNLLQKFVNWSFL